jgi:hypothetical protein
MKTDVLQQKIYRYLLSDLPQEEQSVLEQEFLVDGDLFEQVWAVENELIDGYVRGKLTAAEKDLFERNYLASTIHRERLAFAKNLVRAADSAVEKEKPGTEPAVNRWNSFFAGWNSNRFRWAMAAAVLLFAASSVWLLAENRRLRAQVSQARPEVAAQQRIKELEKELETQREQRNELAAQLAALGEEPKPTIGPQSPPNQVEQRSVVSFLLSPLLMRGGAEPQELSIPNETTAVLLKMRVEKPDGHSFQASLRTVDGGQIWSKSGIKARSQDKSGLTVSLSIPANKIPPSDYVLTLSATNKANELEEVNRYFFRVIKQ